MTSPGMAAAHYSEFDHCIRCGAPFWTRDQPGKWPCRYHPLAAVTLRSSRGADDPPTYYACCGAPAIPPAFFGRMTTGCVRADHTTAAASAGCDPALPRAMLIDDAALDAAQASGVLAGIQPAAIVRSSASRNLASRPSAEVLQGLATAGIQPTPAGLSLILHYDVATAARRRYDAVVDANIDTPASIQRKRALLK